MDSDTAAAAEADLGFRAPQLSSYMAPMSDTADVAASDKPCQSSFVEQRWLLHLTPFSARRSMFQLAGSCTPISRLWLTISWRRRRHVEWVWRRRR